MDKQLEALLGEWGFSRDCSKTFLKELDDVDLDCQLPRKGLDTIRKHLREMLEIQRDYTAAIETSVMRFNDIPDSEIDASQSSEELLAEMHKADAALTAALECSSHNTEVDWFGRKKMLPSHLAALIAHEAMHVGQIIAFCYALDIKIPQPVRKHWALSGK